MADAEDSRAKKRAHHREYMRAWRAANIEKCRASSRAWKDANRDRARQIRVESLAKWRAANPEKAKWLKAFYSHRGHAARRGIAFLLTFEQWQTIWLESGKWEQRGSRRGQYVMARNGDTGPYAVGNVRICTVRDNNDERTYSETTRRRMSEGQKIAWERRHHHGP